MFASNFKYSANLKCGVFNSPDSTLKLQGLTHFVRSFSRHIKYAKTPYERSNRGKRRSPRAVGNLIDSELAYLLVSDATMKDFELHPISKLIHAKLQTLGYEILAHQVFVGNVYRRLFTAADLVTSKDDTIVIMELKTSSCKTDQDQEILDMMTVPFQKFQNSRLNQYQLQLCFTMRLFCLTFPQYPRVNGQLVICSYNEAEHCECDLIAFDNDIYKAVETFF